MAIKSVVNNPLSETINFPCLGKMSKSSAIILFTSMNEGTVVKCSETMSYHEVGHYSKQWLADWELFTGEITLSNQ